MALTQEKFIDGRGLTLCEAFELTPGSVVALVGGGGKTTTMFRLAAELSAAGERVLITTTTHIFPPQPHECRTTVLESDLDRLVDAARAALAVESMVVAARGLNPDGRLGGVEPSWIAHLREQLPGVSILVEADGSKGRPFKAPAAHEPVIPAAADVVIPVVGLSIAGSALTAERVHRPEIVAALTSAKMGEVISPSMVAEVIAHPKGLTQGKPVSAGVVPLLNQADDNVRLEFGRAVARELLQRGLGRVVLGAVRDPVPVRELAVAEASKPRSAPSGVTAIVLAAGLGRRMGALKLGLRLGGKTLLRRVVESALASHVEEVIVVLGHGADELKTDLPGDNRLRTVFNPHYAEGQSWSVKAGVNALRPQAGAAVFLLGDQPLIEPATINAVIAEFRKGKAPVVQPVYRGVKGHPVLFARRLFAELSAVSGDEGGREVLLRQQAALATVEVDRDLPRDVDNAEDFKAVAGEFEREG